LTEPITDENPHSQVVYRIIGHKANGNGAGLPRNEHSRCLPTPVQKVRVLKLDFQIAIRFGDAGFVLKLDLFAKRFLGHQKVVVVDDVTRISIFNETTMNQKHGPVTQYLHGIHVV